MNENLLSIKDLVVEYRTDGSIIHAINGVSLDIKRGETLGLVGETGAGKTTIARTILRILPDPPAKVCSGTIEFDGEELLALSENQMRKIRGNKIAMIFQDPMTALDPIEPVGKQIMEAVKIHNTMSKEEAIERAKEMLEMVDIPRERYNEYPHQFSGGMKQRVVIAMALACNPELLLADEPTTALDVTIQAQVLEMMRNLQKKMNTSVLLITHDLGIVAQTCDNVAVIYCGEIVEYGSAVQIFDNSSHPYTKGLFASLPRLDFIERRLTPIQGMMPDPADLPTGCKFHERCPEATEECRITAPSAVEVSPGHFAKCLYVKEGRESRETHSGATGY